MKHMHPRTITRDNKIHLSINVQDNATSRTKMFDDVLVAAHDPKTGKINMLDEYSLNISRVYQVPRPESMHICSSAPPRIKSPINLRLITPFIFGDLYKYFVGYNEAHMYDENMIRDLYNKCKGYMNI